MYYPLLRGRQFELIALRELATENATQGTIFPIIEPVKSNHSNLSLAHKVFFRESQRVFLIVNPVVGQSIGDEDIYLNFIKECETKVFKPAFYYHRNREYIESRISKYSLSGCMLICSNNLDADDQDFQALISKDEIELINMEDPERNRTLKRIISKSGKLFIRRDDLFEKEAKNGDYLNIQEHRFTEEHKYFREDNYNGFSDFTVLPSEFIEGGSTPRAVVIHFSYLKNDNSIWIRHFTSDRIDTVADVQGKFSEALIKTLRFCDQHGINNSAVQELRDYHRREHYPGLGTVKKLSIKNHLLIISQYLRTE